MSDINSSKELDEVLVTNNEESDEMLSDLMTNNKKNKNSVYECDVCKRVFTRQLSLNEHKYIHTNCKPYECLKCGKNFRQSSNFQKHQKLHQNESQTNQKRIVCKVCGRLFGRQSYLRSHLISHNKTKTCLCEKCGNTFKYRCDLSRHLKIHENSRQHKCNVCRIGFNDGSSLKRHQKKVHRNQCQQSIDDNINNNNISDQMMAKTPENNYENSFNRMRETMRTYDKNNNDLNRIDANESSDKTYSRIELNDSNRLCDDLNDANYVNSVIDYINVCRILPQPLPCHIFEKVVDLQKEIGLHLGIYRECSTDHFNILRAGLQDLNAIVFEHICRSVIK